MFLTFVQVCTLRCIAWHPVERMWRVYDPVHSTADNRDPIQEADYLVTAKHFTCTRSSNKDRTRTGIPTLPITGFETLSQLLESQFLHQENGSNTTIFHQF